MFLINEPDGFPNKAKKKLEKIGETYLSNDKFNNDCIKIIFIRLGFSIDSLFLDKYPNLTHIISPTTGLNHLDLEEINSREIILISLKGKLDFLKEIYATSEHTLALTLALMRNIPSATNSVKEGKWNRYPFKGSEINGKLVFILGYGRVGKQVSKLFESFGAKIIAYDVDKNVVPSHVLTSLKYGLSNADIISIHLPLNNDNKGFLNMELLSLIKKDAILVNTSRGEILDQDVFFDYLKNKKIAGAAVDVLCNEPDPINNKLKEAIISLKDRLIVTPHIAGFTNESLSKVEEYVTDLLMNNLNDKSN
ncbi:MAG: hypothetical protein CMD72_04485 [Gammaproteobacteria bacterium]|nr:hypothetical protein [Gammaproteobacteria bacterium]